MNTFVLNGDTSGLSIEHLLKQAGEGGVEVRDSQGHVLAFVIAPNDAEALTYAEANLDIHQSLAPVQQALERCDGSTTAELLQKANAAAKSAGR
jgi:hypothetical protein